MTAADAAATMSLVTRTSLTLLLRSVPSMPALLSLSTYIFLNSSLTPVGRMAHVRRRCFIRPVLSAYCLDVKPRRIRYTTFPSTADNANCAFFFAGRGSCSSPVARTRRSPQTTTFASVESRRWAMLPPGLTGLPNRLIDWHPHGGSRSRGILFTGVVLGGQCLRTVLPN